MTSFEFGGTGIFLSGGTKRGGEETPLVFKLLPEVERWNEPALGLSWLLTDEDDATRIMPEEEEDCEGEAEEPGTLREELELPPEDGVLVCEGPAGREAGVEALVGEVAAAVGEEGEASCNSSSMSNTDWSMSSECGVSLGSSLLSFTSGANSAFFSTFRGTARAEPRSFSFSLSSSLSLSFSLFLSLRKRAKMRRRR